MLKPVLQNIVMEKRRQAVPDFVTKNFLKEYLQYPVLEFIYNHPEYKEFVFHGGSALRICFGGPRLSEDLDFNLTKSALNSLDLEAMAGLLAEYFSRKYLIDLRTKVQDKKRLYLKFPVLYELGLAEGKAESDLLFVKIELNLQNFKRPQIEITPISHFGFNFVVRHYSLKFLMTGKLQAIFTRQWFKGKENEINIKGRDFYDAYWYLSHNVKPDFKNLMGLKISNQQDLKRALRKKIDQEVTAQKLAYDLKNFFPDQKFIVDFCKNYEKIMDKFL